MNLFKKRNATVCDTKLKDTKHSMNSPTVPDGLWIKCKSCNKMIYKREIGEIRVCPECKVYFRLGAWERIEFLVDFGTFVEFDKDMSSKNPLNYPGYEEKINTLKEKSLLNDAVVTGRCNIGGIESVLCVMDSRFIMGSMGSVVGEKVTRAFEYATDNKLPIVAFTSSGGARMQEGILSLMQMAKVSSAVKRHSDEGLLYITVLTDPTTGGVTASFAMLGDIILSEPGALVGFAGRRVIEQTIRQQLPDDFQTAEFVLDCGFIDKIVPRENLKSVISKILKIHCKEDY